MIERLPHRCIRQQGCLLWRHGKKWRGLAAWPFACLLACLTSGAAAAQKHSRADLRADVARMQGVVQACAGSANACDARAVPDDAVVAAGGALPKFTMRWEWLRQALESATASGKAGNAKAGDRVEAMQASADRLEELSRQIAPSAESATAQTERQASFAKARRTTDDVLARVEFDKVAPPSWWDRLLARFWGAVGRFFDGIGKLGQQAPWLGKALELLLFAGAAVGLVVFVRRNFQRQRLAAGLRGEQPALTAWDREATDWAALADRAAGEGEWREAVHCLYWAAIVRLEGRRAWRHNPSRTPREYVRLLKPGSVQRESLGGLTGLLERVWYGLRPAGAEEYRDARTCFDLLSGNGSGLGGSALSEGGDPASASGAAGSARA